MGVYHLMGLGMSPGVITGPLSYLAQRYQRWNTADRAFFNRSGEQAQRTEGKKVGDAQALVIFTTPEVIAASEANGQPMPCSPYIENVWGQTIGRECAGRPMREALADLLKPVWPIISGHRTTAEVYWCEVDRRNIMNVYERVAQVMMALASVGSMGKEMWANLTGGNNVINLALELGATLSGRVARLYYVQAHDRTAERCAFFSEEQRYWIDLPVMPLALGRVRETVLELLSTGPVSLAELYSLLRNDYWDLSRGIDSAQTLKDEYLASMWRQGLIAECDDRYTLGSQWELIRPYREILHQAAAQRRSIDDLVQQVQWIQKTEIAM